MKKTFLSILCIGLAISGTMYGQQSLITVDSNFNDWSAVPADKLVQVSADANSQYEHLYSMKWYVDSQDAYFYFEYSAETYEGMDWDTGEPTTYHRVEYFDILLNTDGDKTTGSNHYLFQNAGADYLLEGNYEYGMALFYFPPNANQDSWSWTDMSVDNACILSAPVLLANGHYAMEGQIVLGQIPDIVTSLEVGIVSLGGDWGETGCLPEVTPGESASVLSPLVTLPYKGDDQYKTVDGLRYGLNKNPNTAFVAQGKYSGDIVIPDSILVDGEYYHVTSIRARAFRYCEGMTSISIPSSVKEIGEDAFVGCTGLPVVDGVRYADTYLIEAVDKSLASYTIREGTRWIGPDAFSDCIHAPTITIPTNVESIGDNSFRNVLNIEYSGNLVGSPWGARCMNGVVEWPFVFQDQSKIVLVVCSYLAEGAIVIPEGVRVLEEEAFAWCEAITSISFPSTIENIGSNAFKYCMGLPIVDDLRFADQYLVKAVDEEKTSYTIPEGTKWIGSNAFEECTRLKSIAFPNSVIHIGAWAFINLDSLTEVTLPANLQVIEYGAFARTGISEITIPGSVTKIQAGAFGDCAKLKSITCEAVAPPNLHSPETFFYDGEAFWNVDKTIPVYVPAGSEEAYKAAYGWKDFTNIKSINSAKEQEVSQMAVVPMTTGVVAEWPAVPEAASYTLDIRDDKGNIVCQLTFDANGQLINMHFYAPSRANQQERRAQKTASGWQYTIGGLKPNTNYTYTVIAKKSDDSEVFNQTISFKTDVATGLEENEEAAEEMQRYVGGDISMLPKYELHNSAYKDANGKNISDLLTWFVNDCGWNTFRVRIFVNPDGSDPSVCQDLEYVTQLGQRIKAAGAYFMLDFHYSDTWVDALHIQAPKTWKGKSDADMAKALSDYTHSVLSAMKANNATPDFVQVGNEIMYGLCDIAVHPYDQEGDNWTGYLGLLKAGCDAVRDECPNAQIIIHTDRPTNSQYNQYYYQKLIDGGVNFDIIGLSYYPFWHGYLTDEQVASKKDKNNLVKAIKQLKADFPGKTVHIVECAYNFQYWPTSGVKYDTQDTWKCSKPGQYAFVKDLVDAMKPLENVGGINYWFPEEAGNGDDTDWKTSKGTVIESWLNRGFWDENTSNSGHAINRAAALTEGMMPHEVCAPYYMAGFVKELPSGVEGTQSTEHRVQKVLHNGQVVIVRGEKMYTLQGQEIR